VQVRTPTALLPALWRTPPPVLGAAGRARPGHVQVSLRINCFYINKKQAVPSNTLTWILITVIFTMNNRLFLVVHSAKKAIFCIYGVVSLYLSLWGTLPCGGVLTIPLHPKRRRQSVFFFHFFLVAVVLSASPNNVEHISIFGCLVSRRKILFCFVQYTDISLVEIQIKKN